MEKVILGRTGICVQKNGFGALPVQRVSLNEAKIILRKAYENGIQFFDSARAYSDSEEKIGLALSDVRENIYISTKTMATTVQAFWEDLETSLKMLRQIILIFINFIIHLFVLNQEMERVYMKQC